MENRRITRELAMQVLYMWDTIGQADDEAARQAVALTGIDPETIAKGLSWAQQTWAARELVDPLIDRVSPQWPVKRQAPVDRALIRLAVWEITHTQTPGKVIIDEAIEMAKQFSTRESSTFVNGVLDGVLKNHLAVIKP